jgi:hypothetical protein
MKLLWVHEINNNLYAHLKSFGETVNPKIEGVWCRALSKGGNGERRRPYVVSYCCNCNLGTKSRSLCHADREIVCSGCCVLPYKMFNMMYKIQTHAVLGVVDLVAARPCQVCFRVEVSCWAKSWYESDRLLLGTFWAMPHHSVCLHRNACNLTFLIGFTLLLKFTTWNSLTVISFYNWHVLNFKRSKWPLF